MVDTASDLGFAYGIQGVSALAQGISSAMGAKDMADFQRQQDLFNARIAGLQAQEAVAIGGRQSSIALGQGQRVVGAQRVAAAAGGISVNSGSVADANASAETLSEQDAAIIKANAWRQAWGYQSQQINMQGNAELATSEGNNRAASSLVTGGLGAARAMTGYQREYDRLFAGGGDAANA